MKEKKEIGRKVSPRKPKKTHRWTPHPTCGVETHEELTNNLFVRENTLKLFYKEKDNEFGRNWCPRCPKVAQITLAHCPCPGCPSCPKPKKPLTLIINQNNK